MGRDHQSGGADVLDRDGQEAKALCRQSSLEFVEQSRCLGPALIAIAQATAVLTETSVPSVPMA